ncbi:MAG: META domain-containing protein [Anaerolineae bacterium]|nr:META domain-containing protein [Anaerolineae bacterium]
MGRFLRIVLLVLLLLPLSSRFAAAQTDPAELIGIDWHWATFEGTNGDLVFVEEQETYTLLLNADGTISVRADCNVGGGTHSIDGDTVTITVTYITQAACAEESLSTEFIDYLGKVSSYSLNGNELVFTLKDEEGVLYLYGYTAATDYYNRNWGWTDYTAADGSITTIDNPESYSIWLAADNTYSLYLDCGSGSGYITDSEGVLTFTPVVANNTECGEGSLAAQFMEQFAKANSLKFENGTLTIGLSDGGSLHFQALDQTLIGVQWRWQRFEGSDGSTLTVSNPERYSLLLNEDGTVSVQADCNVGGGTYTSDSSALKIELGAMTLAACAGESLSQRYVDYLANVSTYVFQDGMLVLNLAADTGNMIFSPTP